MSGCVSPSPGMANAKREELTRDGLTYTVFYTDSRAEVIRTGYATGESARREAMLSAVRELTGCDIEPDSVTGDITLLRMDLDCAT